MRVRRFAEPADRENNPQEKPALPPWIYVEYCLAVNANILWSRLFFYVINSDHDVTSIRALAFCWIYNEFNQHKMYFLVRVFTMTNNIIAYFYEDGIIPKVFNEQMKWRCSLWNSLTLLLIIC